MIDECKECGEPHFTRKDTPSEYCSNKCCHRGENNGMYGKTHTDEVKDILRGCMYKAIETIKDKYGVDNISHLDETKEKKGQIILTFANIQQEVIKRGFTLLEINGTNKNMMLTMKCGNNHTTNMRWHAFNRGVGCLECVYDEWRKKGIQDIEGYTLYKRLVHQFTSISFRVHYYDINPDRLPRRKGKYHVDHKFSQCEGFKQGILPCIIGSKHNLEMLSESENCSKQDKCSITLTELSNEYYR